ncbi:MAG: TrkA family potassium uptake protein [Clostridia bacterium]|nr:TrkA family potassium uptake protein [Clostridia bacterium]
MRSKKQKDEVFGIIGLGRFGTALMQALSANGKEILVIDSSQEKINAAAEYTSNAYCMQSFDKNNLESVGIQNCDTVIVCIGECFEISVLTTLTVLRLGVKRVISKAVSEEQGCVLRTIGAEVVFAERDMAFSLANRLAFPNIVEYISLHDNIDIMEIELSGKVDGKTVLELDIRKRFGLNIIMLSSGGAATTEISPSTVLHKGDTISVIGKHVDVKKFESYMDD